MKMLPKCFAMLIFAGWACSTSTLTHAALIDNGSTTLDTNTSFEWLDVTATQGLSVNSVLADVGGFISSGFRYATTTEVINLWSELGISTLDQPLQSLTAVVAQGQALFGLTTDAITFNGDVFKVTAGMTDPASAIGTIDISLLTLRIEGIFGMGTTSGGCSGAGDACLNVVRSDWGSWLVRSTASPTVPLPTTLILVVFGLYLLSWSRIKEIK